MSSSAEIRKLMEEQHRIMAAPLAQAKEDERREAEACQVAEAEQVAAEHRVVEARRREREVVLAAEEEAERQAVEKAERKAKRRAEKKKKEEMLGRVASRSKQKRVAEDAEDAEMDGDEACWNCRSRSIPCKRTR